MKNYEAHPAQRLREAGMRATGPRLAILSFLEAERTHPSAEQIHEALSGDLPSLSLSTVYSTLESFLRAGLVRRVPTPEGRLRVDGTTQDHDHAVCRSCGRIFDIPRHEEGARPGRGVVLPEGVRLVDVHIEYEVVCSACGGAGEATEA
jgi:Fur family transcriptional regulator, peroxide stress response regulator